MNKKVEIKMVSGATLYWPGSKLELRSYINSANSRGGNVGTAFTDTSLTNEVEFVLSNVEYFKEV